MNSSAVRFAPPPIAPSPPLYGGEPFERDELLHDIFAETAARHPERIAVRLADPDPEVARRTYRPA